MKAVFENIIHMYRLYNGSGYHLLLFWCMTAFLALTLKRQNKTRQYLLLVVLLLAVIFWFPPTAAIIMNYCIGTDVYWRLLWLFPIPVVIAYASTVLIFLCKKNFQKWIAFVLLTTVIILAGKPLFTSQNFDTADNLYKLPDPTIEICNIIIKDAEEKGINRLKIIVEDELVPYVRQYNANIYMPYGRDVLKDKTQFGTTDNELFEALHAPDNTYEEFTRMAIEQDISYMVLYRNRNVQAYLDTGIYIFIANADRYTIYQLLAN